MSSEPRGTTLARPSVAETRQRRSGAEQHAVEGFIGCRRITLYIFFPPPPPGYCLKSRSACSQRHAT